MSKISNSIKRLWTQFSDKEYRDGFLEDAIDDGLAVQIQGMRRQRNWTQEDLAARAGTKQGRVCQWENSNPPKSLTTLKSLASAFDVALVVKFVPFSEFLQGDGKPIDRPIASFSDDRILETSNDVDCITIRSELYYLNIPGDEHRVKISVQEAGSSGLTEAVIQ